MLDQRTRAAADRAPTRAPQAAPRALTRSAFLADAPVSAPADALSATLAAAVRARPAARTLARGKKPKKKGKTTIPLTVPAKADMKRRQFKPSARPNFSTDTYRFAVTGHNVTRGKAIDPRRKFARLGPRNLAVPHRFSWKDIRDSTDRFVNDQESRTDFERWTDRMLDTGFQAKYAQYADDFMYAEQERDGLVKTGGSSKRIAKLQRRMDDLEALMDHMSAANARCLAARDALADRVDSYHRAADSHGDARADWLSAETELTTTPNISKKRKREAEDDRRDAYKAMKRRKQRAADREDDVVSGVETFSFEINNLFQNVSDLGPHFGINHRVQERMHLNVAEDGSMSPFSTTMAMMSPARVSAGVAVDDDGELVGTYGTRADFDDMDPGLRALLEAIGTSEASVVDQDFDPD